MLSYKHGFHAGNFADVLKHLCWMGAISHLLKKNKPFSLFDTHGGAGLYQLDSNSAQKTQEYKTGITRLNNAGVENALISQYLELVSHYYDNNQYPGSPLVAAKMLRDGDVLNVFELHPSEFGELKSHLFTFPQASVHHRGAYEGLLALTPPLNQRGAVLIDPPYEQAKEYQQVENAIHSLLKRWKNAQVLVWYPKLSSRAGNKSGASEAMVTRLKALAIPLFNIELCMAQNEPEAGMYGCGMCVLNPPWQYDHQITDAINACLPLLGPDATMQSQWLTQPY